MFTYDKKKLKNIAKNLNSKKSKALIKKMQEEIKQIMEASKVDYTKLHIPFTF